MNVTIELGSKFELNIDRLSYNGGRGVGRHFNFVIFVDQTAPGDKVLVEITEKHKNFAIAKVLKILEASKSRIQAPCPVFEDCGGCTWQHISYQEQLKQKQQILAFSLRKHWSSAIDIVSCENNYNYRNRIQLHRKGKQLGYYKRSTNDLVDIDSCLIAEEAINDKIRQLKAELPPQETRIQIARNLDNEVIHTDEQGKNPHALFSQINSEINEKLTTKILDITNKLGPLKHIYDLYAGHGNFSFPLYSNFKVPITAVELSKNSIRLANNKLKSEQIQFIQSDVGKHLHKIKSMEQPSLVLLDPPRSGCDKNTLSQLLRLKPRYIIYISCNLAMLARDLNKLCSDYNLKELMAFDMFPQTEQMESLCLLSR